MEDLTIDIDDDDRRAKRIKEFVARHDCLNQQQKHGLVVQGLMNSEIYSSIKQKESAEIFINTLEGVSLKENLSISTILGQVTPSESSLLHVAASYGSGDIVKLLVRLPAPSIFCTNNQGDTPLHVAAREGKLNTTQILIEFSKKNALKIKDGDESLLRRKNRRGQTALHLAVIGRHKEVAKKLASEDQEVCYYANKQGNSPLCLAARDGGKEMVGILLNAIDGYQPKLVTNGQQGGPTYPARQAIKKKRLDILEEIARTKPELLFVKDGKDENPLHWASSIGFVGGVQFMFKQNSAAELEANKDGHYPIHVACKRGQVDVVDMFLNRWPDPTEFLTRRGQNILHVAAENGQQGVIERILAKVKISDADAFSKTLLNRRDVDGNTPLHLATKQSHSVVVYTLVKANGINTKILNDANLTSYKIAQGQAKAREQEILDGKVRKGDSKREIPPKVQRVDTSTKGKAKQDVPMELQTDEKEGQPTLANSKFSMNYLSVMMTFSILYVHAQRSEKKTLVERFQVILSRPTVQEQVNRRIENLLVVAVLIAGVTFTGALQLPSISNDDQNSPIPKKGIAAHVNSLLEIYIFINMVSLNFSVIAAIILCWSSLYVAKISSITVWIASILITWSIYLMCLAFSFAVLVDLAIHYHFQSFTFIIVVIGLFLVIQTVVTLPFYVPTSANRLIERSLSPHIYYQSFRIYLGVWRFLRAIDNLKRKESGG